MIDGYENLHPAKKFLVIWLAGVAVAGWALNLWAVVIGGGSFWMIVARLIGVPLWPLGAILGWL